MDIIRVQDLCNNEPAIMMQESTDLTVTIQNVDGLQLSVEEDQSFQCNNILYVTQLEVQTMIYHAMLR